MEAPASSLIKYTYKRSGTSDLRIKNIFKSTLERKYKHCAEVKHDNQGVDKNDVILLERHILGVGTGVIHILRTGQQQSIFH